MGWTFRLQLPSAVTWNATGPETTSGRWPWYGPIALVSVSVPPFS
jgi:hypothetical protein